MLEILCKRCGQITEVIIKEIDNESFFICNECGYKRKIIPSSEKDSRYIVLSGWHCDSTDNGELQLVEHHRSPKGSGSCVHTTRCHQSSKQSKIWF